MPQAKTINQCLLITKRKKGSFLRDLAGTTHDQVIKLRIINNQTNLHDLMHQEIHIMLTYVHNMSYQKYLTWV